ncbi:cell division protein FtsA [Leuconostocaceae bacterium ESL0958]|nr:cell division protein FtsA [Leuconostocaceae bacterium ESL0958]
MSQADVTVGLDIGTTMVKVVVAQSEGRRFNVIATGAAASAGLRRGVIVDINETAKAIRQAVDQAAAKANLPIESVVAGLPSNQVEIQKAAGLVSIENQNKRITDQDVVNVTHQALDAVSAADKEVVEFLPTEFTVDGFDGIKDPTDMIGVRLEVTGLAYLADTKVVDSLAVAIEKAGLRAEAFVLSSIALSQAFLSDGERDFGTVLIDLAGGQSTAAVIHDGKVKYTTVDYEGGSQVTKDISTVLGIATQDAESIKRKYGSADPYQASPDQEFLVNVVGLTDKKAVDERYLAEIMGARYDQIFDRLYSQLESIGATDLPGGYLLTGGNAATPALLTKAQEHLGENVSVASPNQIGLRHPAYARALAYASYPVFQNDLSRLIKAVLMGQRTGAERQQEVTTYHQVDRQDQLIEAPTDAERETAEVLPEKPGFFQRMKQSIHSLFAETDDEDE